MKMIFDKFFDKMMQSNVAGEPCKMKFQVAYIICSTLPYLDNYLNNTLFIGCAALLKTLEQSSSSSLTTTTTAKTTINKIIMIT